MDDSAQVWTGAPGSGGVAAGAARGRRRPSFVPVGLIAVIAAVLAVNVTLLWLLVAPRVPVIRVEQGFLYADAQPEQAVAADGWFAFLGLIAGLILAIVAWIMLRHRRGTAVLVALVLGSLVGAWLGWWFGTRLEMDHFDALVAGTPVGGSLEAPLSLGVTDLDRQSLWPVQVTSDGIKLKLNGVIVVQALAAALAYTTLAGFATDPELRANRSELEDDPRTRPVVSVRPSLPAVRPDQAEPAAPAPSSAPDRASGPALSSNLDEASGPPGSPARPGSG